MAKSVITQILAALEDGPMTRAEIQTAIGMTHDQLGSTLKRLIYKTRYCPQRLHVVDWVYDIEGVDRYYPRALYAAGPGVNKKKPKPLTGAQTTARYRERKKMRTLNSVWALAKSIKERLAA